MKTEYKINRRTHLLITVLVLLIAFLGILAFPVKANAAGETLLCGDNINSYNDNVWHSAGASGSPSISGWSEGSFKLSKDRKTLYFDGFKYTSPGDDACTIIVAYRDLTVHVTGYNSFGNNNFITLIDTSDYSYHNLTIEGEANSRIQMGNPEIGTMIDVNNLTISGCEFLADAPICICGMMKVNSGGVYPTKIRADSLNIIDGSVMASTSENNATVVIVKNLKMEGGTLYAFNEGQNAAPQGIYIEENGSVIINDGILSCIGDFRIGDSYTQVGGPYTQTGGSVYSSRYFDVYGPMNISGGALQSIEGINCKGAMNLEGSGYTETKNLSVWGKFTGTGGSLKATGDIYLYGGMEVSGASVKANSATISNKLVVTDGSIECNNTVQETALNLNEMELSGGRVSATCSSAAYNAVYSDKININGGSFEVVNENGPAVYTHGFSMSGGTFYGSSGDNGDSGLIVQGSLPVLSNDIWMSLPDDGYIKEASNLIYQVFGSNDQLAQTVQLGKVDEISVGTRPSTVDGLYNGDCFDPTGLVLDVTFEDGSTSALSYNDVHKDMFSFSLVQNQQLSAGNKTQNISCLGKTAYLGFTVKNIGSPTLTGSVSEGNALLSWTAADGAQKYRVFAGEAGSGSSRYIGETTDTSYTVEGLMPGTSTEYTVYAWRMSNIGEAMEEPSNVLTLTVPQEPEPEPVIVPPGKDDPSGTAFGLLQAKAIKITNTSIKIGWKKVPGAKKYVVYGNKCGTKNKYKKLTTTTKLALNYKTIAGKKVKKGTYYKFIVYALDSKGKVISTSKTVHVATTGGKFGNDKKVTTAAKKGKVSIKKGKTFKLRAKAVPASSKLKVQRHRGMQYESTNKKIATVSSKGVIKGRGKGTCYVYAYTQNGVFAKVKVTVK